MYFDEVISGEWDLDKAVIYYKQQTENVLPVHQIGNDLNTVIRSRPNYTEHSRNKAKELLKSYNVIIMQFYLKRNALIVGVLYLITEKMA